MGVQIFVEGRLRAPAHLAMTSLLIVTEALARGVVERRQQIEGNVGRLVMRGVGAGNVVAQRAEGALTGSGLRLGANREGRRVHAGEQPGRDRLHIALDARDLAREEYLRAR